MCVCLNTYMQVYLQKDVSVCVAKLIAFGLLAKQFPFSANKQMCSSRVPL